MRKKVIMGGVPKKICWNRANVAFNVSKIFGGGGFCRGKISMEGGVCEKRCVGVSEKYKKVAPPSGSQME